MLAFIGSGEVRGEPLVAAEFPERLVMPLIAESMVENVDGELICTPQGWRFLDSRPCE